MPAFKLTKDLYVKEKLDHNLLRLLSENAKDDSLNDYLLQVLNVENAKEQIEILKKITKEITKRVRSTPVLGHVDLPLRFLVHVFFVSTSKNPSRRVLLSHFQGLPENVRVTVIGSAIKIGLKDLCKEPIREPDGQLDFSCSLQLRHNVDTISAVIENFPLGENCVQEVCLEILTYLGKLQDYFFQIYGDWLSPVQQNEVMHHCLETVKVANRICQKSSGALGTKLKEVNAADIYRHTVSKFITTDIQILKTDDFLLDCKTTSSMNIWLLLKHCLDRDCIIYLASRSMFKHVDWLMKSCDENRLPDWLEDLCFVQLSRSSLLNSAYLCNCYGFLAMVAMETLLLSINGKCLLLDVLLQEFLELCKSCSDVGSKLLAAKSISFLTQKIRDYLRQQGSLAPEMQKRLLGDSGDMRAVLEFVWTAWEDSVDAIRFTVKEIFENVFAVHLHSSTATVKDDPLLHQLTKSILNDVSWACKGKYSTLSVLVSHLGSTRMLELHPGIAEEILQQMQEQTLACYASDLYEKLFTSHKTELETSQSCSLDWFQQWLEPVLSVICGSSVLQKKHMIEYVLPRLLKTGTKTLQYIIQHLSRQSSQPELNDLQLNDDGESDLGGKLGALIICLRRARALGLLKNQSQNGGGIKEVWCEVVDVNLLQQALVCKDDQTRLDAFALLCENQKTSEMISELEFNLIRSFVPQNLNNQDPAFRQHFISHLKKFLLRLKESHTALKRKLGKDDKVAEKMKEYKDFLCWLTRCLFNKLYPGSVFSRRTTCLSAIVLLSEIFGGQTNNSSESFDMFESIRVYDLNALLFCLTDTFEDNKADAASLLIACAKNTSSPALGDHVVKELFNIGLLLSQSTRPQDSATAAYLFSVLTHQHSLHKILTEHIETDVGSKHSETKTSEFKLKEKEKETKSDVKMLENEADKKKFGANDVNELAGRYTKEDSELTRRYFGDDSEGTIRNTDEDSELAKGYMGKDSEASTMYLGESSELAREYMGEDSEHIKRYMLLIVLMKSLESQAEVAKASLIVAAANRPLYPTLQCMRYCFADIDFRKIPRDSVKHWKTLVARFMDLCFEISGVVSPVVCNSSPEGNVPVDALTGMDNLKVGDRENLSKSTETVMLIPEYLIVCCWRSVKEISLLLGQLTASIPYHGMGSSQALLTFNQVLQVGEFFTTLLLESKHRGAFELAYAGFVKVTDMLWRSSIPELHQLPKKWLSEVMADIRSGSPESRLCATRRSAGVPFYVQALVTTEPSSTGRQCFRQTMQELLMIAADESVVSQDKCIAKVHSLNILRALYKDSRLKDEVAPYVADGLKVAILGFKSPLWAVRNSATLLMTAMMTRIFGVKRSKDETTFSRKNCQTGRTFFYNYPSLYQFLLEQIAKATEHITSQLHPGLFPILMVLGRLFPSAMEGTDTSLNLAAFIPYVIKCSANPVLKTRVMAAKALQPLVEKDHVTLVFHELLTLLPNQPTDVLRQNKIHGLLLQVLQLCKTVPLLPSMVQTKLEVLIRKMWKERMPVLISRDNRCLATRIVALEVTACFIQHFCNQDFIHTISTIVYEEMQSFDTMYDPCTPSLSEFQTTLCMVYCDLFLSNSYVRPFHIDGCVKPSPEFLNCETLESGQQTSSAIKNQDESSSSLYQSKCDEENKREVENVILKCLNSKSYEVRKTVLEKLIKLLSRSQELYIKGMSHNIDVCARWSCTDESQVDRRFVSVLLTPLLTMLDTEDHEECKIQLLRLLEARPVQLALLGMEEISLISVVDKMLMNLKIRTCSDTLTASVVTFSGVTLNHLLEQELSKTQNQTLVSKHSEAGSEGDLVTMATVVPKFISTIRAYTEQMETSAEVLLACGQALVQNSVFFIELKSTFKSTDEHLFVDAVKCVLDLLQADDLEVRETAVSLVNDLASKKNKVLNHPYVAMTELLEYWVHHDRLADNKHLVTALLKMIIEQGKDIHDHEERLFDRGEMNTYWDELDFTQMLDSAITKYIQGERQVQKSILELSLMDMEKKSTLHVFDSSTSLQSVLLEKLKENVFQCLQDNASDASTYAFSYKDIFFNTPSFQEHVLFVYKTLTMCKYGTLLYSNNKCNVSSLVYQTIDALKDSSLKHVWLPIVYDLLTELSLL